jgi:hypothetical protein
VFWVEENHGATSVQFLPEQLREETTMRNPHVGEHEHPIELSGDGIMRQAKMTAHDYLLAGIADVEELFKPGVYDRPVTEAHPELVAAYAQIAAIDAGAAIIAQQVRAGLEAIAEAIVESRET